MNKIAVVEYNPHPINEADTNKPLQKARQGPNDSREEPSPLKILIKVPRGVIKHPNSGKGGWNLPGQHLELARSFQEEGGRESISSACILRMGPE